MSSDPLIRAIGMCQLAAASRQRAEFPTLQQLFQHNQPSFVFPAAAVRAVASVPSRSKGGQVRQACHQFTAAAMEGLPIHGALRTSMPD